MKRTLWRVLLSTALIAGIYIGSQFFLGKQLEQEVGVFGDQLSAHDSVHVNRLDYQRGLTSGVLHYDVVVTPESSSNVTTVAVASGLLAALPPEGVTLQGAVDVVHGPWLGLQHGFGAARADWALPLPEELRIMLPQYPGREPAVAISAIMTLGGNLQAVLRTVDYDGRIVARDADQPSASSEPLEMVLAGLDVALLTNSSFDRADVDLSLQAFSLSGADASGRIEFSATGLAAETRWQMSRPWVWTGTSELMLELFELQSPASNILVNDFRSINETREVDGKIEATNNIMVDRMVTNDSEISDLAFIVSAGSIDAAAYSDLMMLTMAQTQGTATGRAQEAAMDDALMRIMAGEPWLELERLSLALFTQEDVLVTGRIDTAEAGNAQATPAALAMQSEIRVTTAALRQFVRLYVDNINVGLAEAELNRQSEMLFNEVVELLQIMGYAQVSGDHVTTTLALEQGWLLIGGQRVIQADTWLGMGR